MASGQFPSLSPHNHRRRVLVVEDIPANQMLMLAILQRFGYDVTTAKDGKDALRKIDEQSFDIVLMDCQLPELDGYETTRYIRQRETTCSRMPIVGVTAHAMVGDREKCLAAGMDDYLSKPIQLDDLEALLEKWLSSPRRNAQMAALQPQL